jgi:L-lactate dehydrogenase
MKVSIVGAGMVGSAAAFAMVLRRLANEIVLVDVNEALALSQAEDILHATPVTSPVKVSSGDYTAIADSAVIVLACGVSQRPGESRLQLLQRNEAIFADVVVRVVAHAPNAIIIIASNPVDIMTQFVTELGSFPPQRVIGSGTILDTARFRVLLGEAFGVSPQSVHAYVLGEHGDSEVLVWSEARIGGMPLAEFAGRHGKELTAELKASIDERVRRAAYRIIQGKGSTYYGIGAGLARIIQAVRNDEQTVFTLSNSDVPGFAHVSLSLPRIIGAEGIRATLAPAMNDEEKGAFARSVEVLQRARSIHQGV